MYDLMSGDCLELMKSIPDNSVDLILADPPYGTISGIAGNGDLNHGMKGKTGWDTAIDPAAIFLESERILRTNGALLLFSQEPYTSRLITEAHGNLPFSYRLAWVKDHFANALIAKKAPVSYFEDIVVFFKKYDTQCRNPLRHYAEAVVAHIGKPKREVFSELGHQGVCHFFRTDSMQFGICTEETYRQLTEKYELIDQPWFKTYGEMLKIDERFTRRFNLQDGQKFKSNVLQYRKDYDGHHPTQKPVALLEDLVRTYTDSNDCVLDFTMGSGSTGVACANTGRKFIGIEMDEKYFEIAKDRIDKAYQA